MKNSVLLSFFVSVLYLFCTRVKGGPSPCIYTNGNLQRVLKSASAALRFYERNLELLVPDAAIGTRVLEAQLLQVLTRNQDAMPQALRHQLEALHTRSKAVSEFVVHRMRNDLADEFKAHLKSKLQQGIPWLTDLSLWNMTENNVPLPPLRPPGSSEMDEKASDACIGNLFRTCKVSRRCSRVMLQNVTTEYMATHQLLFMKVAKRHNCFEDYYFRKAVKAKTPEDFVAALCSQVYKEFKENVRNGYTVSKSGKDLALEQVTVCGLFGYHMFYEPQFIADFTSWQHSSAGCFYYDYQEIKEAVTSKEVAHKVVVKREDKFASVNKDEMCSVHFTAVALGATGMFIRRILNVCMHD